MRLYNIYNTYSESLKVKIKGYNTQFSINMVIDVSELEKYIINNKWA